MSMVYWWSDTEWWKLKYPEKHLVLCQYTYHRSECIILWVNMYQHFISLWITSQKWVAVLFWVNKTIGVILQRVCLPSSNETLKCYICFADLCFHFSLLGLQDKAIGLIWVEAQKGWEALVCTIRQTFSEEYCPLEFNTVQLSRWEPAAFLSQPCMVKPAGSETLVSIYYTMVCHITEDCNVHIYCLENLKYQNRLFLVLIVCFSILEEMDLNANCIPWWPAFFWLSMDI